MLSHANLDNYMIVKYDEIVVNPKQSEQRKYQKFGFIIYPYFERVLIAESEKSKRYFSKHSYSLEEMGITKERVLQDFGEIYMRFGFKWPQ